ncbi:Lysine--tRNA ligase [Candidatus Bilamarchaeum dharawalense]|uniref:Lysine--tRNA ligase n=1 Tax=Candidatus Bilamarchaeum dharawalense TaxID=2885759 RepID=A0A5E4LPD4_9ARCH|nr:Lysine--tRNA ligase [Candidatus Bilamarchaeum dharawalense]
MSEKHMHWSEWLAEKVIQEKKEPYVISGGMTTSGPAHLGTLCEFLFPSVIKKAIENRGKECKFYFVADILDAFDGVPVEMERYSKELGPHLGKPLCNVPDPTGQSRSFGDHYLDEARALMVKFEVQPEIIRVNEYYEQGKFDEHARFYLKHDQECRKIIEETSGKEEKKDWSPIMPICEKCGRIATTRVISHDGETYEYACDKDVKYTKGCGHGGKNKIADHRYKIVWRLHWPAWKQVFGTTIEGAGIDHHTKGGSEDTCKAITLGLMNREYHIPYRYGFILFQGKKYSKSKGTGMGVRQMVVLIPVEIIKYMLLRPDLEENIDIDPTSQNLLRTIDDFQEAGKLILTEDMSRADRKRLIAHNMSTDKPKWAVPFLDVLLYYQIYQDWNEVGRLTKDPEGANYLKQYVEAWIAQEFIPEEYKFKYQPNTKPATENVTKFLASLKSGMDALAIHNGVFEFAKANAIEPKQMFAELYDALISKPKGPRIGKLIDALGVDRVKKDFGV